MVIHDVLFWAILWAAGSVLAATGLVIWRHTTRTLQPHILSVGLGSIGLVLSSLGALRLEEVSDSLWWRVLLLASLLSTLYGLTMLLYLLWRSNGRAP